MRRSRPGGGFGGGGWERGEPGEPVRVAAHGLGERVVGVPGERHRLGRAELLDEPGEAGRHPRVGAGRPRPSLIWRPGPSMNAGVA